MALKSGNCVLLTGVTGFLGKVVLEHLVRQREELHCHKIVVLIRGKNGKDGDERFEDGVASSKCFSLLPEAWTDLVEVVDGDLETSELSLVPTTYERLCTEVTHIIHCAGCVKFDQSMAEAADTNVSTTLNVLSFAKKCTQLQHLITTSTAYVTPHRCGPIFETLSPLPQPAEDLHKSILKGEMSDARILEYTQHPNTYTLSKCITEHLLVADHGSVPLTIVRPSIISASWRFPFPGWIDSVSAFAGFLFAFANGLLRVINADVNTILDVIPVDEVAAQLVNAAFQKKDSPSGVSILYSTASLHNGMDISLVSSNTPEYFTHSRVASIRSPKLRYLGSRTPLFYFYDLSNEISE
ncbi:unnamed protein product [Penicillium bialowiezense]